jgi:hypothetical protein
MMIPFRSAAEQEGDGTDPPAPAYNILGRELSRTFGPTENACDSRLMNNPTTPNAP